VATRQDKLTIKSGSGSFVSNVQELRRRARAHIEQGAVTEGYKANVDTVVRILKTWSPSGSSSSRIRR
jgi:hypothetical protein